LENDDGSVMVHFVVGGGPSIGSGGATDGELVARCRGGDQQAWTALVERFSRYVYAITTQGFRLGEAEAEDVFQEVFARTFEHLDRLRDDEAIRPWIGQLTRRLAIDRLRETKRSIPDSDPEPCAPAADEDPFSRLDEALEVRAALLQLPDESREVLERFFVLDQSYRTISDALGIPSGTVASRISRALAKLRVELDGLADQVEGHLKVSLKGS
jgi:RNA polymerase sigma-70 factor (ECF subfamily)